MRLNEYKIIFSLIFADTYCRLSCKNCKREICLKFKNEFIGLPVEIEHLELLKNFYETFKVNIHILIFSDNDEESEA